jgi:hypothetical protein
MASYDVTLTLNLQRSAAIRVRAKDEDAAAEKVHARLEHGATWEDLTKGYAIEEVECSINIDDVQEA